MKLLVVICMGWLTLGAFAGDMVVKLKDGTEVRFDTSNVEQVYFDTKKTESVSPPVSKVKVNTGGPTVEDMRKIGELAAKGDKQGVDELAKTAEKLYENIDYDVEKSRVRNNLSLMRAAFKPLAEAAGRGEAAALEALKHAKTNQRLRSFTTDAYGIAAGMGNKESLEILLNYKMHGFLLSTTVGALQDAGNKNIPEAVDFLVSVIKDPKSKALHYMASQGLIGAASAGNEKATEALKTFAEEK